LRKLIATLAIAGAMLASTGLAHADGALDSVDSAGYDIVGIIHAAAQNNGLNATQTQDMLDTAKCESHNEAYALGDGGHSAGLYQLYDGGSAGPTNGLLYYYLKVHADPFNPETQADWVAKLRKSNTDTQFGNWFHAYRLHGAC
jgi:hypothetical protein